MHEKAIYIHGGQQYHVEHLDFKERKAYVKQVDVDYYTDAIRYTQVRVLEIADARHEPAAATTRIRMATCWCARKWSASRKSNFSPTKILARDKLELPENEMHTTSYWITLERPLLDSLPYSISERQSGMFGLLHALESVATLLLMCDGRDLGTAIGERPPVPGAKRMTRRPMRLEEAIGANAKEFFEPNLYLFDAYPGGIGFSEPFFAPTSCWWKKRAN